MSGVNMFNGRQTGCGFFFIILIIRHYQARYDKGIRNNKPLLIIEYGKLMNLLFQEILGFFPIFNIWSEQTCSSER